MSVELGYSPEEIKIMLDYWSKREDQRQSKIRQGEVFMSGLNQFLDRLATNK